MTVWPSAKAKRVLAALLGVGWEIRRQAGSHRTLSRPGWPDCVFAFREGGGNRASHARQNFQAYGFATRRPMTLALDRCSRASATHIKKNRVRNSVAI